MLILRDVSALRDRVAGWKRAGDMVAVVPTMGALHDGHLSLVAAAKAGASRVIVTIFVNPAQFNNAEDLDKYPRTEADDAALLAPLQVDAIFAPAPDAVYPPGFATGVRVAGLTQGFCGAARPGHFEAVATVVAKLFLMTAADSAYFGEKDWQQLQVVRRMARDLNIPVEVVGCPTRRDADGLALSSRNLRLTAADRPRAPALFAALTAAGAAMASGLPVAEALGQARTAILAEGFGTVDYLGLCDGETLVPRAHLDRPARLLAAAWLGEVRLIDNIAVRP